MTRHCPPSNNHSRETAAAGWLGAGWLSLSTPIEPKIKSPPPPFSISYSVVVLKVSTKTRLFSVRLLVRCSGAGCWPMLCALAAGVSSLSLPPLLPLPPNKKSTYNPSLPAAFVQKFPSCWGLIKGLFRK